MSSSVFTDTNGVVVITHVHPAGTSLGTGTPSPSTCLGRVGPGVLSAIEKFREGHPKALGTVQIMFGAMAFLFGIVMAFGELSLGVVSGVFVWGSIIYIIAGSLTIAAEKSLNKCLVKASLGMNVVATVTAVTGTILYSLDAAGILSYCYDYNEGCYEYWGQHQGVSGVMALFSLLEVMVSISVSAFACKAVCHCPPEPVFTICRQGGPVPTMICRQGGPVPTQTTCNVPPNTYETLRAPKGPELVYDNDRPPQYSPPFNP